VPVSQMTHLVALVLLAVQLQQRLLLIIHFHVKQPVQHKCDSETSRTGGQQVHSQRSQQQTRIHRVPRDGVRASGDQLVPLGRRREGREASAQVAQASDDVRAAAHQPSHASDVGQAVQRAGREDDAQQEQRLRAEKPLAALSCGQGGGSFREGREREGRRGETTPSAATHRSETCHAAPQSLARRTVRR
jgi:hypothetical protein